MEVDSIQSNRIPFKIPMSKYFYLTNRKWDETLKCYDQKNIVEMTAGEIPDPENTEILKPLESIKALVTSIGEYSNVLIYIHGFNNSFQYSAKQFSLFVQANKDEKTCFLVFAWAGHMPGEYLSDRKRAIASAKEFCPILESLTLCENTRIHIMTHSMGGYLLWKALGLSKTIRLENVFFVASDIKKSRIKSDPLRLERTGAHISNYAYKGDNALYWSRYVSSMQSKIGTTTLKGFSNINLHKNIVKLDSKHSHSYFHHSRVIKDIFDQLHRSMTPEDRGLKLRKDCKAYILIDEEISIKEQLVSEFVHIEVQ